jgi:hypothetical protein
LTFRWQHRQCRAVRHGEHERDDPCQVEFRLRPCRRCRIDLSGGEGTVGDQITDTASVTISSGALGLHISETIGALNGSTPGVIDRFQSTASTQTVTGSGTFAGMI